MQIEEVEVGKIIIPNVRLNSKIEETESFEASIRESGIEQPILVMKDQDGSIWLADGLNRLEMAKKLGMGKIKAIIKEGSEVDAILKSVELNVQRGKYRPSDLCRVIKYLRDVQNLEISEIARRIGLSKSYTSELYSIAHNEEVLTQLEKGIIGIKEAIKIVRDREVKSSTIEQYKNTEIKIETEQVTESKESKTVLNYSSKVLTQSEGERVESITDSDLIPKAKEIKKSPVVCLLSGRYLNREKDKIVWLPVAKEFEYEAKTLLKFGNEVLLPLRDELGNDPFIVFTHALDELKEFFIKLLKKLGGGRNGGGEED